MAILIFLLVFLATALILVVTTRKIRANNTNARFKVARFRKWRIADCDRHPNIMYKKLKNGKYESFQLHEIKNGDKKSDFILIHDNPNPKSNKPGYIYKRLKRRKKGKYLESRTYSCWKMSKENKAILTSRYHQIEANRNEQSRQRELNRKKGPGSTASSRN